LKPRAIFSIYMNQEYKPSLAHDQFQLDIAIAEIAASIAEIEQNISIYQERNFDKRTEAVDHIEFHIIDRLNAIIENTDIQDQLIALKSRAEKLRIDLEKIDGILFQKFRKTIREKTFTGQQFVNLIKTYVDPALNKTGVNEDVGYNNLDIFINGLCQSSTLPEQTTELEPEMVYYQKTPARIIVELTNWLNLTQQDIFVDLGSGLGQVVILFHLLTGIRARGVEFDQAYCRYAIDCAAQLNLSKVTFINADARTINYTEGTLFFLFTPFTGKILQDVLSLLQQESLQREIRVITYGPCITEIAAQDWLYPCSPNNGQSYQLGIFSSINQHASNYI
jgi:hypothetical protein